MNIRKSIVLCLSFILVTVTAYASDRGISVIGDLSHKSGKLGVYKALIIGINDYKDPKIPDLTTAVKDAHELTDVLKDRYGFEVELLLNDKATKRAIDKALRKLAASAKEEETWEETKKAGSDEDANSVDRHGADVFRLHQGHPGR